MVRVLSIVYVAIVLLTFNAQAGVIINWSYIYSGGGGKAYIDKNALRIDDEMKGISYIQVGGETFVVDHKRKRFWKIREVTTMPSKLQTSFKLKMKPILITPIGSTEVLRMPATKVIMETAGYQIELWLAKDERIPVPTCRGMWKEVIKYGIPLKAVWRTKNKVQAFEVTDIEEAEIPPGIFKIPEGYLKVERREKK